MMTRFISNMCSEHNNRLTCAIIIRSKSVVLTFVSIVMCIMYQMILSAACLFSYLLIDFANHLTVLAYLFF